MKITTTPPNTVQLKGEVSHANNEKYKNISREPDFVHVF